MATIQCMVHEAGRIAPNRPAFLAEDIRINYGELDLMVSATAILLRAAGIKPGARIGLFMENGWAQAALIHALIRIGAIACPIHTRLPVAGVKRQLERINARVLIARVREESREALADIVCLDPDGLVSRELSHGQNADTFDMTLGQSATIVFTSGSSSDPKAALQTYGNHYYSAYGANLNIRLRSEDCWLLSLPLYHVGGLGILFRCAQSAAAVAVMNPGDTIEKGLELFPVTHLSLVHTQLRDLLNKPIAPEIIKRLKAVIVGGSAVPTGLLDSAREKGWPVFPSYGLTEMNAQVSTGGPARLYEKRNTSGAVLRYREVRIAPDGEIMVKGGTLFSGYVEGDRVRSAVDENGWFATGDFGALDAEGYLTVTGRKDHLIISGGENIQPEEVERALLQLPGVRQAVVVPVNDDRYGQRPVAFLDHDGTVTNEQLCVALSELLPKFKIPDVIYPWPDKELAGNGLKPSRAQFKALAANQM